MTNENKIMELLQGNSTFENALLMERIQRISELTRQEIEENPCGFFSPFTTPEMYLALCNQIDAAAKMEEPINSVTHYLLYDDDGYSILSNNDDYTITQTVEAFEEESVNHEIYTYENHEPSYKLAERVELYTHYMVLSKESRLKN